MQFYVSCISATMATRYLLEIGPLGKSNSNTYMYNYDQLTYNKPMFLKH